jgi:hypothetical protein
MTLLKKQKKIKRQNAEDLGPAHRDDEPGHRKGDEVLNV